MGTISRISFKIKDQIETFRCLECDFESEYDSTFKNHLETLHPFTRKNKIDFCYLCREEIEEVDIHGEWSHLIETHIRPKLIDYYEEQVLKYIIYVLHNPKEE